MHPCGNCRRQAASLDITMKKTNSLSPVQDLFLSHNDAFVVNFYLRFEGDLKADLLKRSVDQIVVRHEILRTVFPVVDGARIQKVIEPYSMDIQEIDLRSFQEDQRPSKMADHVTQQTALQFDVETGPLWRLLLFRIKDSEFALNVIVSHTIFDGWSGGILLRELLDFYCAYATGKPSLLSEVSLQYIDYTTWLNETFKDGFLESRLTYWRGKFSGSVGQVSLVKKPPRSEPTNMFKRSSWTIPAELMSELKILCNKENVSLYVTVLAYFTVLLASRTKKNDLIIGVLSSAERNRPEMDGLLGPCNGIVPLRIDLSENPTFKDLQRIINYSIMEGSDHYVPLGMLGKVGPPMKFSLNLMTSVPPPCSFALPGVNAPLELPRCLYGRLDLAPLNLILNPVPPADLRTIRRLAPIELNIVMLEVNGELRGDTWYNTDYFEDREIASLMGDYLALMENGVFCPSAPVFQLMDEIPT
jgi:myxalamid-type nonribosomal peptide synthetase MxaA